MIILKILILGGTYFLGPHLIEELQNRGHEVTLFNRGTQNSSRFQEIEQLHGDRDGNLEALEGRQWDAVIDTSGHLPRIIEASSKLLAYATKHYTFVSSIGVYADFQNFGIDEEYPVAQLEQPTEEITEKTYGALKADCEWIVQSYFPEQTLIVRPGLIMGPGDPTDRFTYWPCRIKEGGNILAPGQPNNPVQFIDVRDLAKWIVDMIENQVTGIYNVTGESMPFETLLRECQQATEADVNIHWVSEDFLIKHDVQDWEELPLWLSSKRNMPGFLSVSNDKASSMGLTTRPLFDTITTILEWETAKESNSKRTTLSREKEQQLLDLWKREQSHEI